MHSEGDLDQKPLPESGFRSLRTLVYNDVERMNAVSRRRYLGRRLAEIEWLIQATLFQPSEQDLDGFPIDLATAERETWEKIMDLNYLEASRQAILQTLTDLGWPTVQKPSSHDWLFDLIEGARSRGSTGLS